MRSLNKTLLAVVLVLMLGQCFYPAFAGGTDRIFSRMDGWVSEMRKGNAMSADEAKQWQDDIQAMKDKVEARMQENGGSINLRAQDADLKAEIDTFSKPLLDRYQAFKRGH